MEKEKEYATVSNPGRREFFSRFDFRGYPVSDEDADKALVGALDKFTPSALVGVVGAVALADRSRLEVNRRGLLKLALLGAAVGVGCAGNSRNSSSETFINPETSGEFVDGGEVISELLSDPATYSVFKEEDGSISPVLAIAISEGARAGASGFVDATTPLAERFRSNIAPLLNEKGIGDPNNFVTAAVRRKHSSMGDVYFLKNPNGKSFYIRLTPEGDAQALAQVRDGVNLQRNYYQEFLGENDRIITELGVVAHPETGAPMVATVAEDLGRPLGKALDALGPERLNRELTNHFLTDLVPRARRGLFKQDINGNNVGNIVWDEAHFKATGEVRFHAIDFAERAVDVYNPEAAVRHTYDRTKKLFEYFSRKGIGFNGLPDIESFLSHSSFEGLNPQLLADNVFSINTVTREGNLRRIFVPRSVVDEAGKTGTEIYEQLMEVRDRVTAGERSITTADNIQINLIENALDGASRARRFAEWIRPGVKVIGTAAVAAEIVGWVQLAQGVDRKLLKNTDLGYSFREGENQINLDSLFESGQIIKQNQIHYGYPLANYSKMTTEQVTQLIESGVNAQAIHNRLVAEDPYPVGLVNENLVQGAVFGIANGQDLTPTLFFSAIHSSTGEKRLMFFARGHSVSPDGTATPTDELKPVVALIRETGSSHWKLDEQMTNDINSEVLPDGEVFINEYSNRRIFMMGRRGGYPPPGEMVINKIDPAVETGSITLEFTPYK